MSGFKGLVCLFHLFGFARLEKFPAMLPLFAVLLLSTVPLDLSAQSRWAKLAKPSWSTSLRLSSDTGYGLLEWEYTRAEAVEMFRLKERFEGKVSYSYVTGRELKIYRANPGLYEFRLRACARDIDGFPKCGAQSSKLNFVVTEAIYDPYLEAANDVDVAGLATSAVAAAAGGPADLRPGLWYNPAKSGHGWSFYWANDLALASNPQNSYDLYGIWYTFEAKTRLITPICEPPDPPCGFEIELLNYRPLVATMQLVQTGANSFGGGIYITRSGTEIQVGSATITFGANSTAATINWNADFQHEQLAEGEALTLLLGEDESPFGDPTNFSGLWDPASAASYYIIDNIGTTTEVLEVVFTDDDGDPAWIQAQTSQALTEDNTSLCFFYINGGYAPNLSGSIPSNWLVGSACDFNLAASSSNRNARRYFTDYEAGRYWVNFTLPAGAGGNAPAGGAVSIGSSASPASFAKQANFHRIYTNNGNSCDISASVPSCNAVLTWFTDGDYPGATAFAYNQTTGQRSALATSTAPVMENQLAALSVPGSYIFELRMTSRSGSRLIAESAPFSVIETLDPPMAPGNLNVAWTNETSRAFEVSWSHANTAEVDYYKLEEDDSTTNPITRYTVSPGTILDQDFAYLTGPFGTYRYRVKACSTASGAEVCSGFTAWLNWQVSDPNPPMTDEHPWGDNAYGTQSTNVSWNYAMGFHFTAAVNGSITELGGLFNGSKTVKLFRRGGPELASVSVTSNNAWSYVSITPVAITAGVEYTVATYLAGSGASYRSGVNLPQTFGSIEIVSSTWAGTGTNPAAIPDSSVSTTTMYGQADVGFVAGGPPQVPPVITAISDQQDAEESSPSVQVVASDADGTIVSFADGGTLPAGLSINNAGLISGTIAAGAVAASPYSVTITVADNDGLSAQDNFIWMVNPAPNPACVNVFVDDFESDQGWLRNLQGTDTATKGLWERGNPATTTYNAVTYQLGVPPSGAYSLVTDGRGTGAYTYDVDNGPTSISSPLITLPAGGSAYQLEFDYNFAYKSSTASTDRFAVYAVTGSGEVLLFEELDDNTSSHPGAWKPKTIDLSALAGQTIRIRFLADDDIAHGVLVEAQVDDVRVCYIPSSNTAPVVTQPADQSSSVGATISPLVIQVTGTDAEGDATTCSISGLPAGLAESTECTITGTVSAAVGNYAVTVTANDGQLASSPVSFNWNIVQATTTSNPEQSPDPVAMPSMAKDSTSSRVGATVGAFRVDESGSATYSIALLTAPGSGGMAPQIALNYSSQAGNGPLGVGWSLGGLSTITRCSQTLAQDGANAVRGISLTATDRFCLDGQRLIAVAGAYGAINTEYRTEIDGIAKLVSLGTAGTGPASFTVWRKDGSITEYGNTADSRIEARTASDTQTVLVWAQNRIQDSAANYMDYVYTEIAGVAGAPVEFVLASVNYTGNTTAGTAPYAELVFSYASGRADATRSSVAGSTIAQTQLLSRIDSRARASATGSMVSLRSWFLAYGSDGYGRKILNTVTQCSDSGGTICFNPTQLTWHSSDHAVSTSGTSVGSVFSSKHAGLALADINGDARPDLLLSQRQAGSFKFRIALAQSGGGFASPGSTYAIPKNGATNQPVTLYAIDLNADGFQDVIYPSSTQWKGRLSNGASLGSEFTVSIGCCGLLDPPFVRIMDFDGDGLSDVVTNRTGGSAGLELILLRNVFSPAASSTVGFAAAEPIAVNLPVDLFPDQSIGGWDKDIELARLSEIRNRNLKQAKTFDYNGDGAVDVLVKLSQRYTQCVTNCNPQQSPAQAGAVSSSSHFIFDDEPTTAAAGDTEAFAEFYAVLLSGRNATSGRYEFNLQQIVATGIDCIVFDACDPYAALPSVQDALPVDINADGLADFAFRDDADQWRVQANLGGAFATAQTFVVTQTDPLLAEQSHFQDLNGDGYPEFLYPSSLGSSAAVWVVHGNSFGTAWSGAVTSTVKFGNSNQGDSSIWVDFNGDGMLDNLLIDFNNRGKLQTSTTQVYPGQNSAGGALDQAVNLVTGITDGLGARTTISYKPLTDTTVYTRMNDAKNANWDAGYAVYDLIAPIYVVSQAQSSAPIFGSLNASSSIEYHYVGAKLQGGGRGFLGFGEVISYDPQSGIRTNTRYRQDFPYTGLPADTTQMKVNSAQKLAAIGNPASAAPVNWAGASVGATSQPPALPSGTLLSYAVNQWGAITTVAGHPAKFPFIAASLERSYTLAGNFERKVLTNNTYNSWGDLTNAVVKTYASDSSTVFATLASTNSYVAPDTAKWHLGRLSQSVVTHARSGTAPITRTSSFAYDNPTGILNQEVIEPGDTAFQVTTSYQLDPFGNRSSVTASGAGFAARTASSTFDPLGRFVIETRNAYNQLTQKIISWDAFGNALAVEDINGVRTTSAVDHMGRPFISYTETGAWSKTIQRSGAGSNCPTNETAFYALTTGGGQPSQYRCFDVLGREIRTATQGFNGVMIDIDRYFDESGRLERVSEPYFATGTRYWNRTAYDALGRLDSVLAADGNDQTYDYAEATSGCITGGPRQVKTTNGLGQSRLEVRNALGESLVVYDHNCGPISYDYDAVGNLTRVTGADGAITTTTYDLAGRKTAMNDLDKGSWQYAYNPLGELTRQLDGKNQAIDFTYDLLGRVTDRRELSNVASLSDATYTTVNRQSTTWNNATSAAVQGKGQSNKSVYRTGESGGVKHQRDYTYDGFGRLIIVSTTQEALQLAELTTYDQYGRVFQQFDASGDDRGLRYVYNAQGYLEQLKEAREGVSGTVYQNIQALDARGQVTDLILGNGVTAAAFYDDASGRLQRLEAFAGMTTLQDVDYLFDVLGNLTQRHDRSTGQDLKEMSAYDAMNRLTGVDLTAPLLGITAPTQTLSMTYSVAGNITSKSGVGSYLYGQNGAGPHAVTSAGGVTYTYDLNGNQISGDGRTITYTVFDKPDNISKGSFETQFAYGIGNTRYQRIDLDNGLVQKTTWYLGSTERITEGASTFFKRYLGGVAIATFYPATGVQQLNYLLKDHIGSIHTITNEAGQIVATMHFSAFGERQGGNWQTPLTSGAWAPLNDFSTRGFTGQEQVDEMGIVHMNGRIYDPKLGRYLQADPFVQAPKNSQSLNRYSYVLNNPLSYTDPSGYFLDGGLFAFVVSSIILTARNYIIFDRPADDPLTPINTNPFSDSVAPGTVSSAFGNGVGTNASSVLVNASVAVTTVGDTTSATTGGKFANGAATKSFSQADNRSTIDNVQTALDVAGLTPGVGIIADGINAVISLIRGDFVNAGLNVIAAIPIIGQGATAAKLAAKGGKATATFTVIGRTKDIRNLKTGERSLLDRLPDKGNPKANWKQNSGVLRQEMNKGQPIRDISPGDTAGEFLNAERNLLRNHGWSFDPSSNLWMPTTP